MGGVRSGSERPVRSSARVTVGVISDTHGTLNLRAEYALAGVDHIIHAGDIDTDQVLARLAAIASVTAVRGNCDSSEVGGGLPRRETVVIGGVPFIVAHKAKHAVAEVEARALEHAVVITGHTHVPRIERQASALWVNPGSASRPLHGSVASVALVEVVAGRPEARIVPI